MSETRPTGRGLFAWVVDHPVGVLMVFVAAVVFGWVSYQRLPLDLMPDITYPSLTVRTEMPGAAPEEVELQVSRLLEENLATLQGLVELESRSRAEQSDVLLEFDWGTDMDRAAQDVRERVQVTVLPDDAERPLILRYDPSLDPILRVAISTEDAPQTLAAPGTSAGPLYELRELAEEELKRELEALDGVAAVRVKGGLEREVLVEVREDWLAARGVRLEEVQQALVAQNVNISGGSIQEGETEYLIRTLNQFTTLEEIRDVEVVRSDGHRVPIGQLARVREYHKDREVVTHLHGREAVELEVYREADANIVHVARSVKQRLGVDRPPQPEVPEGVPPEVARAMAGPPPLVETLPEGTSLEILDDQAAFIEAALVNLRNTAVLGGILAVLVLFMFLGNFRATAIIATAIPVSIVCTFAPLQLTGVTLNLMSLGGLALGVGMLVDNAVVVLESIQTWLERGCTRREAAIRGVADVASAVAASTFTTVAVFFPIVFVEGVAGQIFGDLSLAVVFSLLASLVVALFLVPMLGARTFSRRNAPPLLEYVPTLGLPAVAQFGESWRRARGWRRIFVPWLLFRFLIRFALEIAASLFLLGVGLMGRLATAIGRLVLPRLARLALGAAHRFGRRYERFSARYQRWLDAALARPGRVLGGAVLALAVSAGVFTTLGAELIPEVHQGRFTVEAALPVGTPLRQTVKVVHRAEQLLQDLPHVESIHATIGSERRADSDPDEGEHTARILVQLAPGGDVEARETRAMERAREVLDTLPDLDVRMARPTLFSFRTPVEVVVSGYDLATLRHLSDRTVRQLGHLEGLRDVRSSLVRGFPEIRIRYDRLLLHRFGLDPGAVATSVRNKVRGAEAEELIRGDRRIDMRVRLAPEDRATVDQLRRLNVNPSLRPPIPLEAVARIEEGEGPSEIRRINQKRVAVITANLEGFDLQGAGERITDRLAHTHWPDGYRFELAGQSREMEASLDSLRFALLLSVFLVYVIMASTFEHLLHPLVIMGSLPLAAVGVVLLLPVAGVSLSVVVLIGFIVLAGVVVNNAIVLVDTINRRRRLDGLDRVEAIRRAGLIRLRPILITTSTTVLGLLPLALGWGEGAEIQSPLALTVIAGLTSSTLLTLVVIPVLYDRVNAWLERRTRRESPGSPPPLEPSP